jgi:hypothetical protein
VTGYGDGMLVWVASFPRSGNTFLRILLHRWYGVRTSTVYDVDGVAQRLGANLIGFTAHTASFAEMRDAAEVYLVKTHRQRDADVHPDDPAICLVRDGRDALVSWARQASENDPGSFETHLSSMITRTGAVGTGGWGSNVLSWLRPAVPHRPVLTYPELTATPQTTVRRVMAAVAPRLRTAPDVSVPGFDELQSVDNLFFRRGTTGSYRDEMPEHLQDLFWAQPDNLTAMDLLGWSR